jgi:hypothetical protein
LAALGARSKLLSTVFNRIRANRVVLVLVVSLLPAPTEGRSATVLRNTNLRPDASAYYDPIELLLGREKQEVVYALTGYVREVKVEADCDFHVQVAVSKAKGASEVIVEIPRTNDEAQGS